MSAENSQIVSSLSGAVKVLVVDDSAVVRQIFSAELAKDPAIEVVGAVPDPYVARDLIVRLAPDVITLDIEMPRMDGLTFLQKLMHYRPMPVVVVSSLTAKNSEMAIDAMRLGAVEVVAKPSTAYSAKEMTEGLAEKVKAAARIRVTKRSLHPPLTEKRNYLPSLARTTNQVLAIGASTGGTVALENILCAMPPDLPGTVVTQHMPEVFTRSFAMRLNELTRVRVKEASDGDSVVPGVVLIAPGGKHLVLRRSGARYFVSVVDGPQVNRCRPSVDVMFRSVAQTAGKNAIGTILTGMGQDGAKGLLEMKNAGSRTIAQDEESSLVFGMPRKAIELGAAQEVVSLQRIPERIMQMLMTRPRSYIKTE